MAGRINASGESFRRTTNLPSRTAFTLAGWGYRHTAQTGAYRYFAGLEDATSNSSGYLLLGWASDNILGLTSDGGTQGIGGGPATGEWFYWFIRSNGTNSYQAGHRLSGGTDGASYAVTCHVVTVAGREDDRTLTISVRER